MMTRQALGKTGLEVSSICCGAGPFGSGLRGKDLETHINLYREAGGNFFDTAHCYAFWTPYGAGCSECALGDYVRRNGKGDLVIGTKGGHPGAEGYRKTDHWLAPARIEADIDDSLGRLGVDAIDLFWLHRDDTRMAAGEIVEILNGEIRRGRIRQVGASNWRTDRIAEANAYAAAHALQGFVANQPEYNLARKTTPNPAPGQDPTHGAAMLFLEAQDMDWHRQSLLPVIPYTSTAGGYFARGTTSAATAYDNPVTHGRLARAQSLARELNATPGQVALAWLLHQEFPVIPIIGTQNPVHLREDLEATRIRLSPKEMAWLTAP